MPKVSFIIINYNNISDTLVCLKSFYGLDIQKLNYDIYLIDNGSKQPICESDLLSFQTRIPIKLYNLNKNHGFAEGNNIGIREAQKVGYDYYVLLNNDTVLVDDSVVRMIRYMDSHEEVGIGGLVNYYYSNPDEIWQAGALFFKKNFNYRQILDFDKSSNTFVDADYVPGSSFFIRKEVIDSIGLLDANYFAYREEADYCWRVKQAGFKVGFLPNTRILHKVGKSSTSLLKQYLRFRNELYFCSKFGERMDFAIVLYHMLKTSFKLWLKQFCDFRVLRTTFIAISDYRKRNLGYGSIDYFRKQ